MSSPGSVTHVPGQNRQRCSRLHPDGGGLTGGQAAATVEGAGFGWSESQLERPVSGRSHQHRPLRHQRESAGRRRATARQPTHRDDRRWHSHCASATTTMAPSTAAARVRALRATSPSTRQANPNGDLHRRFTRGVRAAAAGKLRLRFPPVSTSTWTTQLVARDPDLLGGNVALAPSAMSRGEGTSVFAVVDGVSARGDRELTAGQRRASHHIRSARRRYPLPVAAGAARWTRPDRVTAAARHRRSRRPVRRWRRPGDVRIVVGVGSELSRHLVPLHVAGAGCQARAGGARQLADQVRGLTPAPKCKNSAERADLVARHHPGATWSPPDPRSSPS